MHTRVWFLRSLSNYIIFGMVLFGIGGAILIGLVFRTHPISWGLIVRGGVLGSICGALWSITMWKLLVEQRLADIDKRNAAQRRGP